MEVLEKQPEQLKKIVGSRIVVDGNTGEFLSEAQDIIVNRQPDYYKVYINHVLEWQNAAKSISPILHSMLARMTFASLDDPDGGQLVSLPAYVKKQIAKECGVSVARVNQVIPDLLKANILKRLAPGVYQVNPKFFGRGEWKYVNHLRATFDYDNGIMETEIDYAQNGFNRD